MDRTGRASSGVAGNFNLHFRWVLLALILSVSCLIAGGALRLPASAQSTLVVRGDSYSTNEDKVLTVKAPGVLKNDRATSGKLSATVQRMPDNGDLKLEKNGSFVYTPDRNFNGGDTFVYRASNSSSRSAAVTVRIAVRAVNDIPNARDDGYTVVQRGVLRVRPDGVLENDTDVESKNLVSSRVSGASHGKLTLRKDGSFVYAPDPDHTGADIFRYRATDAGGKSDVAAARISITPANKPPNAPDDTFRLLEDENLDITIDAEDPDGDTLSYEITDQPENGSLTGTAPNLTYTPNPDYNGRDSFTYTASDGNETDEGEISLDVVAVNDEPSFSIPNNNLQADEDSGAKTIQDFATNINKGAENESSQTITFQVTNNTNAALFSEEPEISAAGTLTFTPAENASGNAAVGVLLRDSGGTDNGGDDTSTEKQFTIAVNAVNDEPEVTVTNDGPVKEGDSATITANARDGEGETLVYSFDCDDDGDYEVGPQSSNTTDCTFDDSGAKKVDVRVSDGTDTTMESTTVNVENVAPTATLRNSGSVSEGSPTEVSFEDVNGRSTVTDPSAADTNTGFRYEYACDGTFEDDADYESASGNPSSTCTFGQDGTKTIAARVIDKDGGSTTYTTEVVVNNVKPGVTLSGPAQVEESTTTRRRYDFTVTDPGDDTFTVASGYPTCGTNGTLVDGSLTTNADGGYFECIFPDGDEVSNVEIKVTDSDGATDTDNRLVTVNIANVAPVISIEGDASATEGQTKTYTYTIRDAGNDPNPSISESCGDADYTSTPAENSFDCTFPDGDGENGTVYEVLVIANDGKDDGSGTKEVTVSNAEPEVTAAENQESEEGVNKTFGLGSFTDPGTDGPWNATVNWGDGSTDTTFTVASPGDITDKDHTYTDDGSYEITVTVAEDGQDAPSGEATSSVEVANVAPVADDQNVTTDEGVAKTIRLTGSDVADDPLTFRISSLPTEGKLFDGGGTDPTDEITQDDLNTNLSGNEVTYLPKSMSFFGDDSLDFTACDDANPAACDEDGATVSIAVSQSNDAPGATDDARTTTEDTQLVFPASDLAANDSAGANEDAQTLTVTSVGNAVNGTVSLDNGRITFDPDANFNGAASFDYTVEDNGQTSGADDFKTDTGKVNVTVTEVNDSPVASDDPAQGKTYSVAEDSQTALTVSAADGVLSNDTKGPANESGQTLDISDSDSNATGIQPGNGPAHGTLVLNADGSFEYTPTEANYSGTDTFEYEVCDDGTTNGNADPKCDTATATIAVTQVNDPPEAVDDRVTLDEDAELVFDPRTNDTKGPSNESGQTLSVSTTFPDAPDNGTATLITSGNDAGKVRYTPNVNYFGDDSFTYEVCDNGSPSECDTATVNVTVTAVNDAPVADDENFGGTFRAVGNTAFVANDPDDSAPDPTGPQKTIQGDILAGDNDVDSGTVSVVAGTFPTNDGGSVELQADGDFTFYPKAGTSCTDKSDSFEYTVTDGNTSVKPGTAGTDTGRVTIAIEDCVWYVNDSASSNGDGRSHTPLKTLSGINGAGGNGDVDAAGQTIFLYPAASYSGGLPLENDQKLLSKRHGLVVSDGGSGNVTLEEGISGGADSTVSGGLVIAQNNTVQGISLGANSSGASLSGTSVGDATVNTATSGPINNTSGKAVDISGGNLNMVFTSATSQNSTTDGIRLDNVSGTFTASGGSVQNAADQDIDITGDRSGSDNVNFTYDGTITDDAGTLVNVSGQNGGTKDFNGNITDGNDGDGNGISLTNNSGANIRFDGGLTLSTGTSPAFTATGGGTVVSTDPSGATDNTIATTTGTALNVANTGIGGDNLTFKSISASGATSGIVLNNTGTSTLNGGLTVSGSGSEASGGTIQNTTSDGVSLTNTRITSLTNLLVKDTGRHGIFGTGVSGFTFSGGRIEGAGDGNDEDGMNFATLGTNNLSGTATIRNSVVTGSTENNVTVANTSGSMNMTVDDSDFTNTLAGDFGEDGVLVRANGTAQTKVRVHNGSTFSGLDSVGVAGLAEGSATLDITVEGNTFTGTQNPNGTTANASDNAVELTSAAQATLRFAVRNNTMLNQPNTALDLGVNQTSRFEGTIAGNTIGNGSINSGSQNGYGIDFFTDDDSTSVLRIDNNRISGTESSGINVLTNEGVNASATPEAHVAITNNTVATPEDSFKIEYNSIFMQAQNNGSICARVAGNSASTGSGPHYGTDSPFSKAILASQFIDGTISGANPDFRIEGLNGGTGSVPNETAVANYLASQNPASASAAAAIDPPGSSPFTGVPNGTCQTPTEPTLP